MKHDRFKRVEQKYLFPAGYAEVIRTWLEHACVPDPLFPSSEVASIYFDTPGLFHCHESRNGEFLRAKVRLRWYSDPGEDARSAALSAEAADDGVRCYLEVKTKQGALSEKKRSEVTIPARILPEELFSSEQIPDLAVRLLDLGYRAAGMLMPVLIIRYRRRRYLDAGDDSAVAMDTEIRCTRANEAIVQGMLPVYLDMGVLEIKGMNRRSREMLDPIASYLRKSPFSKYTFCLESLLQPLGRRV